MSEFDDKFYAFVHDQKNDDFFFEISSNSEPSGSELLEISKKCLLSTTCTVILSSGSNLQPHTGVKWLKLWEKFDDPISLTYLF